ncbi:MAG: hypothetical protein AAGD05_16790, partial [Bacteroidota bacterium]
MKAYFQSDQEILGFNDRWLSLIGIPVISFVIAVIFFSDELINSPRYFFQGCMMTAFVHTVAFWWIFRRTMIFLRRKYPATEDVKKRLIYLSALVVGIYMLLNPVLKYFTKSMFAG